MVLPGARSAELELFRVRLGALKKTAVRISDGTSTSAPLVFVKVTFRKLPVRSNTTEAERFPLAPANVTGSATAALAKERAKSAIEKQSRNLFILIVTTHLKILSRANH